MVMNYIAKCNESKPWHIMAKEIERKFLVRNDSWRVMVGEGVRMRQGYVPAEGHVSVRVRVAGDKAWVTLKSPAVDNVRGEWEYEIPVADAEEMLDSICQKPQIEKVRYTIPVPGFAHGWEIDVFGGENAPLVMAEIEMPDVDTPVELPDWIGEEVTGDHRYSNLALARCPYSTWGGS